MISLIEQPAEIAFTKNPIILTVRATASTGIPYGPQAAKVRLTLGSTAFAEGDQIVLRWTDGEASENAIAFNVATIPTLEYTISARPGGASTGDYIAIILPQLRAHSIVGALFDIVGGADYIEFISKEAASGWVVEMVLAGVDASSISTDFVSDNTPNEYQLLLDVFAETAYQATQFAQVAQSKGLPDGNGYCTFNISEILDGAYESGLSDPPIPSVGTDVITPAANVLKYSLRYREDYQDIYVDMPTDGQWQNVPVRLVMGAGISQPLFSISDFFTAIDNTNSLLHWWPSGKVVGVDQPEYIAWYNYLGEETEIEIQLVTTTSAGEQDPEYPFEAKRYTVATNDVVLIPISPAILNLSSDVLKYKVRVGWQNPNHIGPVNDTANDIQFDVYSPFRSYYIDRMYYESIRYLQYLNGFGIPETLRCVGEFYKDLEVQRTIIEKVLQPDYTPTTAEQEQYQESWTNNFTYRTGYLRQSEVDALQELVIKSQVWEVTEGGYIPLQVTSKKFPIDSTFETLHSMTLVTEPKLYSRNYSNTEINIDPTNPGWLHTSGGFWLLLNGKPWPIV